MHDRDDGSRLTVYYDGGCPLCSREIGFYRRCAGANRIEWVDLMAVAPDALGDDLDFADAMARFHVRRPDGRLLSGARAFAAMWRELPRFRLPGRVAGMPGIVSMLELGYRVALWLRRSWRKPVACEAPSIRKTATVIEPRWPV